jgi:hypothetical protein
MPRNNNPDHHIRLQELGEHRWYASTFARRAKDYMK